MVKGHMILKTETNNKKKYHKINPEDSIFYNYSFFFPHQLSILLGKSISPQERFLPQKKQMTVN